MTFDVIRTSVDSWTDQGLPSKNFGNSSFLRMNGAASKKYGWIFFGKPVPPGVVVTLAQLKTKIRAGWGGGPHTQTGERIIAKWAESKITDNNKPAVDPLHAGTVAVTGGVGGQELVMDVTLMMQDVANGAPWYGIRLKVDTTGDKSVHSAEAADETMRPVLEVTYVTAPSAPTDLHPTGGRSVADSTPTVLWTFKDTDGDTQAKSRVQVATDSLFASIVHDSGLIANVQSNYTVTFALTNNTTYYWRVLTEDSAGQQSAWSEVASFVYSNLGVLTITSPPDGGTVEDTTPPILHTFTGRTQDQAQHLLYDLGDNMATEDESGFEVGTGGWSVQAGLTIARDATKGHTGVASLRVDKTSGVLGPTSPEWPVIPGHTYEYEPWVWGNGVQNLLPQLIWYDAAHAFISSTNVTLAAAPASWSKGTLSAVAPTNAAYVRKAVYSTAAVFSYWIDDNELRDASLTPVPIYDSGRRPFTDVSFTIPDGKIKKSNKLYRLTLRVWDTLDREDLPSAPSYVEKSADFLMVRSPTPTPPSSIVATPVGPHVQLDVVRASAPDEFALKVDGVYVRDHIDPADVFLTGTTYRINYYGAVPNVATVYEVEAIVSSKYSMNNPTDTETITPTGVWIMGPDDGVEVIVRGADTPDLSIGESGETFFLVGRRDPVRITDAVRGYEGTINGLIADYGGVTALTYVERLESLKGLAGTKEVRLLIGRLNIPVILGSIKLSQMGVPKGVYEVSLEVWQVDEFTFAAVP